MSPVAAPVPGPLNFHSSDVQTSSFQVSWDHSANDIALYRLSWAPFSGGDTMEVSVWNLVTATTLNRKWPLCAEWKVTISLNRKWPMSTFVKRESNSQFRFCKYASFSCRKILRRTLLNPLRWQPNVNFYHLVYFMIASTLFSWSRSFTAGQPHRICCDILILVIY